MVLLNWNSPVHSAVSVVRLKVLCCQQVGWNLACFRLLERFSRMPSLYTRDSPVSTSQLLLLYSTREALHKVLPNESCVEILPRDAAFFFGSVLFGCFYRRSERSFKNSNLAPSL